MALRAGCVCRHLHSKAGRVLMDSQAAIEFHMSVCLLQAGFVKAGAAGQISLRLTG